MVSYHIIQTWPVFKATSVRIILSKFYARTIFARKVIESIVKRVKNEQILGEV